jgi:hypothetical protein
LNNAVDLDGTVTAFLDDVRVRTLWTGGRLAQALGGVRVGHRGNRVSLFAAVRGGVNSYSGALRSRDAEGVHLGRATTPLLGISGIVELSVRSNLLRLEAGQVISYPRSSSLIRDGVHEPTTAVDSRQHVQMSVGWRWRF